jgi:oligoendopeptidase F
MNVEKIPRQFVPEGLDLKSWSEIEKKFNALQSRRFRSREGLERWLFDLSELLACLGEEWAHLYIAMTTQTHDREREKSYLDFIQDIKPKARLATLKLMKKYMNSGARRLVPKDRYFVLERSFANQVELFSRKNLRLEVREAKLSQRYQKLMAGMTIRFDGKEQTLQQMARYLEEQDRILRQKAWEKIAARRLKDRARIEDIFDKLFKLRKEIAQNAGLADYREYAFRDKERFDYTVEDCENFHRSVEKLVVPAVRGLQEDRRERLGLDNLKPWDLNVDPEGRPRLRPFEDAAELIEKTRLVFQKLDPELGDQFAMMADNQLLDLESRKGKAPGGYSTSLEETRVPFIFMNAAGRDSDLYTLLHEAGHSFHTLACRGDPLIQYRHSPLEFAEVASMGMELLAGQLIDEFYPAEEAKRSWRAHLEEIIRILPWIATIDAFQHWLYTHPDHTSEDRREAWLAIKDRFRGIEDYQGYEDALAFQWHSQLHIFQHPFYYIEYGIAQLGALELWQSARKDSAQALRNYKQALALGGARPLPELFKAAGLNFDFSEKRIGSLVQNLLAGIRNQG